MNISNDQKKLEIVSRLVKEGHIDFDEAIMLLVELPQTTVYIPVITPDPYRPHPFGEPQVWYVSDGFGNTRKDDCTKYVFTIN